MLNSKKCYIVFHVIEDKNNPVDSFYVQLEFMKGNNIDISKPFEIKYEYLKEYKYNFKTNLILNLGKTVKFLVTLYFGENHITIFKSKIIGVCYEIIKQLDFDNKKEKQIDVITFKDYNNIQRKVSFYDSLGNKLRKRFLLINCPIKIDLKINKFDKIVKELSYKITILPSNNILLQRVQKTNKYNKFNIGKEIINNLIEKLQNFFNQKNDDALEDIEKYVQSYKKYFEQNLMNKNNENWDFNEFSAFYYYYRFKLFYSMKKCKKDNIMQYFLDAQKIFLNIFQELGNIFSINIYEKIKLIVSLYNRLIIDCYDKDNKGHIIGQYTLLNIYTDEKKCYKYAFEFISKIIDNLKENSVIFYPILQANSGFSKNLNSDDEKEIFEISMINLDMVKNHLKSLIPNYIYIINHPLIKSKRGSMLKNTGCIFIYENSIFQNNIGYFIKDIIYDHSKDAAIIIAFTVLHEIFMHIKLRSNSDFSEGKETPSKFIGKKFEITNFYYTNEKNIIDKLAIYNSDINKLNSIPEEGESGRMLEYFFEEKNKHIIYILKNYLGYGELLSKVNLIVSNNMDDLQKFVFQKIKNVQILNEKKSLNIKHDRDEFDEDDKSNNKKENEEMEISDEVKEILNLEEV